MVTLYKCQKSFLFFYSKCGNNNDKILKKEESTKVLKILGLIDNIHV